MSTHVSVKTPKVRVGRVLSWVLASFVFAQTGGAQAAEETRKEGEKAATTSAAEQPSPEAKDIEKKKEEASEASSGDREKESVVDEGAPCRGTDAAELKVLTALRERHEALDEREHHIEAREALFLAQKVKLTAKMDALSASVTELEKKLELGEPARKAKEDKMHALVEAIDSLSAKKAAPMLSEADPTLVGEILRRVGPARTAALLAVMPSAKAARLINEVGADSIQASPAKGVAATKSGAKP